MRLSGEHRSLLHACDERRAFQHTEQHRDMVLLIFFLTDYPRQRILSFCYPARLLLILPPLFRIIVYNSIAFAAQSEHQPIYNI